MASAPRLKPCVIARRLSTHGFNRGYNEMKFMKEILYQWVVKNKRGRESPFISSTKK